MCVCVCVCVCVHVYVCVFVNTRTNLSIHVMYYFYWQNSFVLRGGPVHLEYSRQRSDRDRHGRDEWMCFKVPLYQNLDPF